MKTMEEVEEPIVSRWVHQPQSRREAIEDIDDYVRRLNELYALLDRWCRDVEGVETERGSIPQLTEYPVEKFRLARRDFPTYTIYCDNRRKRVKFVPDVVWIIGGYGRVSVYSKVPYHNLVDMGGPGRPGNWCFETADVRAPSRPLDHEFFLKLLRGAK